MKNSESEYQEKIKNEARFWDERAEVLSSSGRIPLWFDNRRGEDVTFIPLNLLRGAGIRANPILFRIVFSRMIDFAIEEATKKRGHVLDLGCGAGWLSLELARYGMTVDGYDICPKQIEIAKKISQESQGSSNPLLHGNFGSTNYQIVDLNQASLEKEKYEAVVSFGTLHHIQRLKHILKEVHKSLKQDGKFIFYEYIGYYGPSRIFPVFFKILGLFPKLIRILVHKNKPVKTSQFEGASKKEIISFAKKRFSILRMETRFLFLLVLVSNLRIYRLPNAISVPLVKFLYSIDKKLIKSKLFKGPYVFVVAQKNYIPERGSSDF